MEIEFDMVAVGKRIRDRRKELKLNQSDIYDKCGLTTGALSRIENGLNVPNISIFYKLSNALDCSLDFLVGKIQEIHPPCSSISNIEILNNYLELSEDDQEEIDMMILMKYKRLMKFKEKEEKLSRLNETISSNNIA